MVWTTRNLHSSWSTIGGGRTRRKMRMMLAPWERGLSSYEERERVKKSEGVISSKQDSYIAWHPCIQQEANKKIPKKEHKFNLTLTGKFPKKRGFIPPSPLLHSFFNFIYFFD